MYSKSSLIPALAIVLAILVSGCDDVTQHEPGVYKGTADPDATVAAADQRSGLLAERAKAAFTDR